MSSSKTFITENFLLQNDFGRRLFHDFAKTLPIIDYHNHLEPEAIAADHSFENITQAWLQGDHYKWRAMRALGIEERFITGSASDEEKFLKWADAVPYTIRNPLYHWTHLELKRYFEIDELLGPETAPEIYLKTSEMLQERQRSVQGLLAQMKVELVCTTDDPLDDLKHHVKAGNQKNSLRLLPSFRPDKAYAISDTKAYNLYLERLETASNITISSFEGLLSALENRIDFFHETGGRLADHGLERLPHPKKGKQDPEPLFTKLRNNKSLNPEEAEIFRFEVLQFLCKCYHRKGWTQQFHLGALRNTNQRILTNLGPDTGFDSIGDFPQAASLQGFLNALDQTDQLAKTILYNLNPQDNELMATMAGNFNDGSIKGKVQYGSAWWFLDQKDGIEKQLNALSNVGLISTFIGMLTDSRSFLSFPRHEYFRRVLCNLLGEDVARGELPADEKWLGKMVQDICYYNARNYFDF